jgi:hypothetical protein
VDRTRTPLIGAGSLAAESDEPRRSGPANKRDREGGGTRTSGGGGVIIVMGSPTGMDGGRGRSGRHRTAAAAMRGRGEGAAADGSVAWCWGRFGDLVQQAQ